MSITFGAVGDIISVSLLVKDLLLALDDSRGSSAEYQAIARELNVLDTALLQVEQLSRSRAPCPELNTLYDAARQTASKCRDSVTAFKERIRKYENSLSAGGVSNAVKAAGRKLQWRATQKSKDIERFRAEVTGFSEAINMLLITGAV